MTSPAGSPQPRPRISFRAWAFRLFVLLAVVLIALLARAGLATGGPPPTSLDPTLLALATLVANPATPSATSESSGGSIQPLPTRTTISGTLVYSAREAGRSHLWAISQGDPAPTRLTTGDFNDREPAASPDGRFVAFASDRNGGWDLYLLDLVSGEVRQLTQTTSFEGQPTWSPDGVWLAYEYYAGEDLDIRILPVDGSENPIQLTDAPSMDSSPSWDPAGNRIAFISDRDGLPDVYLANLQDPNERYLNLTHSALISEADPAFAPDGKSLAYSGRGNGFDFVYVTSLESQSGEAKEIGLGRNPEWSPGSEALGAILPSAQTSHFLVYPVVSADLTSVGYPSIRGIESLAWSAGGLPPEVTGWSPEVVEAHAGVVSISAPTGARVALTRLAGVDAPAPMLSDLVDDAFSELRTRAAHEIGWDVLGRLENAFVGINAPMPPGFSYNDWLYTGRAFALDPAALTSGLIEVVREDYGAETYWRLYLRVIPQDGSLGEPIRVRPWDFSTRYTGDPTTYDRGGSLKETLPDGYYVDLTKLAADYGFERVPAMSNWRTYFQAARYSEFARTDGLTWLSAMLQIYPPEAIVTPTPYRTPTATPTRTLVPTPTPWYWRWILTATALAKPSSTSTSTSPSISTLTPSP